MIKNPFIKYFETPEELRLPPAATATPIKEERMSNLLTPQTLIQFAPSLAPHAEELVKILNSSVLNTPLRQAHFLAQAAHESVKFSKTTENMNYSAEGLANTFKKYFPTPEIRAQYARKPEQIGNRAYANRNGNGNEASGDGYRYRGRGYLQLTGKSNYNAFSIKYYGDDRIVKSPELVAAPVDAMQSSIWYWETNNVNKWADADDVVAVSKLINLGNAKSKATPNGMEDRKRYLVKAKALLKI